MLTFRITFFLVLTQATQEPLSEAAETADEEEDASTFKSPVMVQQQRCWRNVFFGMNIKKKLNQQHFSI